MAKELKQLIEKDFEGRFAGMTGCVLIDYHGLNSEQTQSLRSQLRADGVRMNVIQNRIAKRVFAEQQTPEDFRELLRGPIAVLVGEDGAVTAAKLVVDWSKKNQDLAQVKGGLLEGKTLSIAEVQRLAKLPDRPTLQSRLLGTFLAPAAVLAGCAQSVVAHFAGCVKARHDELAEE